MSLNIGADSFKDSTQFYAMLKYQTGPKQKPCDSSKMFSGVPFHLEIIYINMAFRTGYM